MPLDEHNQNESNEAAAGLSTGYSAATLAVAGMADGDATSDVTSVTSVDITSAARATATTSITNAGAMNPADLSIKRPSDAAASMNGVTMHEYHSPKARAPRSVRDSMRRLADRATAASSGTHNHDSVIAGLLGSRSVLTVHEYSAPKGHISSGVRASMARLASLASAVSGYEGEVRLAALDGKTGGDEGSGDVAGPSDAMAIDSNNAATALSHHRSVTTLPTSDSGLSVTSVVAGLLGSRTLAFRAGPPARRSTTAPDSTDFLPCLPPRRRRRGSTAAYSTRTLGAAGSAVVAASAPVDGEPTGKQDTLPTSSSHSSLLRSDTIGLTAITSTSSARRDSTSSFSGSSPTYSASGSGGSGSGSGTPHTPVSPRNRNRRHTEGPSLTSPGGGSGGVRSPKVTVVSSRRLVLPAAAHASPAPSSSGALLSPSYQPSPLRSSASGSSNSGRNAGAAAVPLPPPLPPVPHPSTRATSHLSHQSHGSVGSTFPLSASAEEVNNAAMEASAAAASADIDAVVVVDEAGDVIVTHHELHELTSDFEGQSTDDDGLAGEEGRDGESVFSGSASGSEAGDSEGEDEGAGARVSRSTRRRRRSRVSSSLSGTVSASEDEGAAAAAEGTTCTAAADFRSFTRSQSSYSDSQWRRNSSRRRHTTGASLASSATSTTSASGSGTVTPAAGGQVTPVSPAAYYSTLDKVIESVGSQLNERGNSSDTDIIEGADGAQLQSAAAVGLPSDSTPVAMGFTASDNYRPVIAAAAGSDDAPSATGTPVVGDDAREMIASRHAGCRYDGLSLELHEHTGPTRLSRQSATSPPPPLKRSRSLSEHFVEMEVVAAGVGTAAVGPRAMTDGEAAVAPLTTAVGISVASFPESAPPEVGQSSPVLVDEDAVPSGRHGIASLSDAVTAAAASAAVGGHTTVSLEGVTEHDHSLPGVHHRSHHSHPHGTTEWAGSGDVSSAATTPASVGPESATPVAPSLDPPAALSGSTAADHSHTHHQGSHGHTHAHGHSHHHHGGHHHRRDQSHGHGHATGSSSTSRHHEHHQPLSPPSSTSSSSGALLGDSEQQLKHLFTVHFPSESDPMSRPAEVVPGLWLGGWPASTNAAFLSSAHIVEIVNCAGKADVTPAIVSLQHGAGVRDIHYLDMEDVEAFDARPSLIIGE